MLTVMIPELVTVPQGEFVGCVVALLPLRVDLKINKSLFILMSSKLHGCFNESMLSRVA